MLIAHGAEMIPEIAAHRKSCGNCAAGSACVRKGHILAGAEPVYAA
jgi:hypothetical protein